MSKTVAKSPTSESFAGARATVGLALIVATGILSCDVAEVHADCAPRCSEYRYNDLAKLRLCRPYELWDEQCDEPWTLTLLKPDGTEFRGLGRLAEISVPPTRDTSSIFARDGDDEGRYVVYDLKSEAYQYDGREFAKAQFEWETQSGLPHPDGCTDPNPVLGHPTVGLYDLENRGVFPPTLETRLREWCWVAMWSGYILLSLLIAWWPLSAIVVAAALLVCWIAVTRALQFLRPPGSVSEVR